MIIILPTWSITRTALYSITNASHSVFYTYTSYNQHPTNLEYSHGPHCIAITISPHSVLYTYTSYNFVQTSTFHQQSPLLSSYNHQCL
jgi:hypothetical protein